MGEEKMVRKKRKRSGSQKKAVIENDPDCNKRRCTRSRSITSNISSSEVIIKKEEKYDDDNIENNNSSSTTITNTIRPELIKKEEENDDDGGENHNNDQKTIIVTPSTNNKSNNGKKKQLPTPIELSRELCRIVDTDRYSLEDALLTLDILYEWADTGDAKFLKSFHMHAGIIKVLDFLTTALKDDGSCERNIRLKSIEWSSGLIVTVIHRGINSSDKEIAKQIAASAIEYDGISTLTHASVECTAVEDFSHQSIPIVRDTWYALRNLFVTVDDCIKSKEQAIALFGTGIDVVSKLKSYETQVACQVLESVLVITKRLIVSTNYITKEYIQSKNIISEFINVVYKKNNDGVWNDRRTGTTRTAIEFFYACHQRRFLNGDSDYKQLLPFFLMGLQKYPTCASILLDTINFLNESCYVVHDKQIVKQLPGVMESLGLLLASNGIDKNTKNVVGALIGQIATLQ